MSRAPWIVGSILAAALIAGPTAAYATTGHGGGHTPVQVCHNGGTIEVDDNALRAHKHHGDKEGPCQSTPTLPVTPPVTTPTTGTPIPTTSPPTTTPPTPPVGPVTPPTEPPVETPQPTEPTDSGHTTAPEPTPSTPPTIRPEIQDYISCLGGAFVLDNTSSTVTVVYTINGFSLPVPPGRAFHTDAEGAPLFQPTETGYTITAGDRTWVFKPASDCPVVIPPTPEPTEEVTPSPSTPVTPVPTISPTPTRSPSPMPEIPNSGGDKPTSVTPAVSSPPTATTATGTTTDPRTETTGTVSSKSLAMTGTDDQRLTAGIVFGGFLLLTGASILWARKKNK